jgi:hypothetical protein
MASSVMQLTLDILLLTKIVNPLATSPTRVPRKQVPRRGGTLCCVVLCCVVAQFTMMARPYGFFTSFKDSERFKLVERKKLSYA